MLNTLQNFYKAIVTDAWESGTGNRYVSVLPTPTSGRLVVNPSNATKREIVEYSAVGTDGGGNYVTLSVRGVGGTTDQDHDINEPVRMNLTAEDFADVQTEITGLQDEIDTLVLQNAPNASDSVKGIAKLSVAAVESGTPVVVGDNDPRIEKVDDIPDDFVDESAGSADAGKGVRLNADGKLDETLFNPFSRTLLSTEYTRFYSVSNTVRASVLNNEVSLDSSTWAKLREIQINEDMPLGRVTCQLKTAYSSGGSENYTDGQWYVNGTPVSGVFSITRDNNYSNYSYDFSSLSSGDLIQIYVRVSGSSVDAQYAKDISINFDSAITRLYGLNLLSDILVTDDLGFDFTLNQ